MFYKARFFYEVIFLGYFMPLLLIGQGSTNHERSAPTKRFSFQADPKYSKLTKDEQTDRHMM